MLEGPELKYSGLQRASWKSLKSLFFFFFFPLFFSPFFMMKCSSNCCQGQGLKKKSFQFNTHDKENKVPVSGSGSKAKHLCSEITSHFCQRTFGWGSMQEGSEHLYLLSSLYICPSETREQQVLLYCILCPEVETGLEMPILTKTAGGMVLLPALRYSYNNL